MLISQGFKLGKLEFKCGRALYFAGENPDDVRMRWMATTQQFGLTPEDIDKRELSRLPGGPTVLICCHPTKNAESLVPRGGGAFLNEVDGNLTCKRDDLAVELHWCGKFRGPDFAPMLFQLKVVTHERLKDADGNLIQTVVALALSDEGLRDMSAGRRADEDKVLLSINEDPRLSSRERARQLGWFFRSGDPYCTRVVRAEKALEKSRLRLITHANRTVSPPQYVSDHGFDQERSRDISP